MLLIFNTLFPVFGLIALGAAAGNWRVLGPDTGKALSEFIFRLAIPALLFRTMLRADLSGTSVLGLWGTQFASAAVGWALAALASIWLLRRPATDSPAMGMSAVHGNLLLLGLPVALSAFGPAAAPSVAVLLSLHSPVLWLVGTIHYAVVSRSGEANIMETVRSVAQDLGRNPVILALIGGTLARLVGLELPVSVDRLLELLAAASVPCALVALGLSLTKFRVSGETGPLGVMLIVKLLLLPVVAWVLGVYVFALPPTQLAVAVLFAAMPTGANAFLFADRYGKTVGTTSAAVAVGTVVSFVSLAVLIYLLAPR